MRIGKLAPIWRPIWRHFKAARGEIIIWLTLTRQPGPLPELQLIDILGIDLRLDNEVVGIGHDQHDHVASSDHATDRMYRQLEHRTVLRGANLDALELVLGGDLAFDELANLGLDLAHLLGDIAAQILIDLDDLQLGLGDLAFDLGRAGDQLSAFPLEPRLLALQRGEPGELNQILRPKLLDADELAADQAEFLVLGGLLRSKPPRLFLELVDALPILRLLPLPGRAAQLEQLALALHHIGDLGVAPAREHLVRKLDGRSAVPLALEPRFAADQLVQPLLGSSAVAPGSRARGLAAIEAGIGHDRRGIGPCFRFRKARLFP